MSDLERTTCSATAASNAAVEARQRRLRDLLGELEKRLAERRIAEDRLHDARQRIHALFRGEDV